MKNKKITFWVIVILLILLMPMTIFSSTIHFTKNDEKTNSENDNHEFKYNGKLYFYNEDELLGIYNCENPDGYCDYAINKTKNDYNLNERKVDSNTKITMINNRYAFLIDSSLGSLANSEVILYDISLGRAVQKYKEVKNYGVGIDNDYYIIKNSDDLWGVVSIGNEVKLELPFTYNYLGLTNKINDETGKIESTIFAALKDDIWQLIDINGAVFTENINNEIFSYNNEYIILKDNGLMYLVDYKNKMYLNDYSYRYIDFYNKFLQIIDAHDNTYYLYDLNKKERISNTYVVASIDEIKLRTKENTIEIYHNDNLEETIAIE